MLSHLTRTPNSTKLFCSIESYRRISGSGVMQKTICPRPGATLVINLQGIYRANGRRKPACAVMGIREAAVQVESEGARTERVHVRFTPTGLRRFSPLPANLIANL